jgi:hypothetical protein
VGYLHVSNLYSDNSILMLKEVYALEKIDGTSAHVSWKDGKLSFFAGCASLEMFTRLFDLEALKSGFEALGHPEVTVFGEAYGGKVAKLAHRYGKDLGFVAFDVKVGDCWLSVPNAEDVVTKLGIPFVWYQRIPCTVEAIDEQRDRFSVLAFRRGMGQQPREGVVLRPIIELTTNDGSRLMAKHKRAEDRETKTEREVGDPAKLAVLAEAEAIADEWVTLKRLEHVLDKLPGATIADTPKVIAAMVEDVVREGKDEIVDSKEARKAIGAKAARLFKDHLKAASTS